MKNWKSWIMPVLVVALSGIVAHDRLINRSPAKPSVPSSVNGVALGRAYGPFVLDSLGDAWLAASRTLSDGKTVAEAQGVMQETWQAGRTKAFLAKVAPGFTQVLPEGTEPKSPSERAAVAKLWSDFAKGLKGGR